MNSAERQHKFLHEQYIFGKDYLAKFLGMTTDQFKGLNVLEVGGGEFGLLQALDEYGAYCTGIDISKSRVDFAKKIHRQRRIKFFVGDICDHESIATQCGLFDIIVLRDVIEHIPQQEKALVVCSELLKPNGLLFLSFPPFYSPFGGHQQNLKVGKRMPFIHVLPGRIYQFLLKCIHASPPSIRALMNTRSNRVTIPRILKINPRLPFAYEFKKCYIIRPDFEIRYKLKQRSCFLLNGTPIIREIFSTGCLITLRKHESVK